METFSPVARFDTVRLMLSIAARNNLHLGQFDIKTVTRPDISFAVNVVSRNLEKPSECHWQLIKRILPYLKGTANMGLLYSRDGSLGTFSDADHASDKETRKSTSGIVCKYANAIITWQSKRQHCVALSTIEAEYVSETLGAKEIIWL